MAKDESQALPLVGQDPGIPSRVIFSEQYAPGG